MRKRFCRGLAFLLVIPGLMLAASCAKKAVKSEAVVTTDEDAAAAERLRQERLREEQLREEERLRAERERQRATEGEETAERERFLNQDIYFEFDESKLLPEAKEILKEKAKWLKSHAGVSVIIEGHCDERGTNEYNMALGDRRARNAKNFLSDLGIAADRMTTTSYGEEKPLDSRHTEEAWAKNRRAHFVID